MRRFILGVNYWDISSWEIRSVGQADNQTMLVSEALSMAEDEGFEPSVGCPTHAFQACALGRYANPPVKLFASYLILWLRVSVELTIIYR